MEGILLVDKPAGMTSHDVVDAVRRAAKMRRVGHTGTLDPAATGLLIMCIGKATRLAEFLTGMDKVYEGAMRLGIVTDSYDLDGEITETHPVPAIGRAEIEEAMEAFTGQINQMPPMVSAVKIGGERLYKRARNGEIIERPARPICIHEFAFLNLATPDVQFRVRCSSGTYVRSLCHDVGQRLGCGAALASLRRTRIGRHRIEDAVPLEHVKTPEDIRIKLVPMEAALDLPRVCVDGEDRHRIVTGNMVIVPDLCHNEDDRVGWVQIVGPQGELVALGQVDRGFAGEGSVGIQPKRVFVENK